MLRFLFWLLVVIPSGTLFVVLALANRHDVRLGLDPFRPTEPVRFLDAPLFVYLFGALFLGLLLGGVASWIAQGKWRQLARARTREAYRWKSEADRLLREQEMSRATGGMAGAGGATGAAALPSPSKR